VLQKIVSIDQGSFKNRLPIRSQVQIPSPDPNPVCMSVIGKIVSVEPGMFLSVIRIDAHKESCAIVRECLTQFRSSVLALGSQ